MQHVRLFNCRVNIMAKVPSYRSILKSSTIIGGSQVIQIGLRIVQIKILAILLGPMGVGLVGLYQSTIDIAKTVSGLGIGNSGVREVSKAAASGDPLQIATTIITLRRVSVALGALGMVVVFLFRGSISQITFGNTDHADAFAFLSVTLFFASITSGQTALVQGLRRLTDLAKLGILGALWGLVFSVPIIYVWRENGIAPYLMAVSTTAIFSSWWYARKIPVQNVSLKPKEIAAEAKGLISLGVMLMLSGLMTTLVTYLIRVIIVRQFGVDAAGLYHAATQLSNVYIGFILGAMGMDFYPRLTAAADDNSNCNRLVNEQAEIGLLMATPGLLATLTFAPLVIQLFYSDQFIPAYDILQWQVMGTFIRVASWPMGFVQLAKGAGKVFFLSQFIANAVHVLFIWLAIRHFGLVGTGIAFFGLYVFHIFFIYGVVRYLTGFTWSKTNKRLGMIIIPVATLAFFCSQLLSPIPAMAIGTLLTLTTGFYCLKRLHALIDSPSLNTISFKFKQKTGWGR